MAAFLDALAERFHLNAAQIRKDLAYFGEFGVRGVGYYVKDLKLHLRKILGLDRKLRVAVTPTFSRSVLMPRLRGFLEAYPEVDLTLQVSIPLLDGTTAGGAQDTSIAIFSWDKPAEHRFSALSKLNSTRVRIAFFENKPGGSPTPDYELGMRYWENGIADDMTMDFGEFVMKATLVELNILPKGC